MNSPDYWRKRELDNISKDYISDEKLAKRLKSIYSNQLDEIQKEIDSFYQRYADKEGISYSTSMKRVSAHDVKSFESRAKKLVETKDFSELANKQLRLYNATMQINRLEMLKSRIGLHLLELSDDVSQEMRQDAFDRILETYERQAGILGDSVKIDTWKKAEQIVKGSFDGADFSERIWGKVETRIVGNTNVLYAEISKLLEQYLINGKGSIKLAPALKERFNTSTYEAERLARTEIRRMQTSAQVDFMQENGVTQYKFIAEPTACHICRPLDDKVFDLEKMMVGTNASPMHPNCRCSITPYIDRAELEKRLDYINSSPLPVNLQLFAKNTDKDELLAKIKIGAVDKATFNQSYQYFKNKFKQGVRTPIETVYDKGDRYYHIVNHHNDMLGISGVNKIIQTLQNPETIFETQDKFGIKGVCYIENNGVNPLIVITRNGIITAYKPSKSYLHKIKGGRILWSKN